MERIRGNPIAWPTPYRYLRCEIKPVLGGNALETQEQKTSTLSKKQLLQKHNPLFKTLP